MPQDQHRGYPDGRDYATPQPDDAVWTPGPYDRDDRYWAAHNQPADHDAAEHGYV